MFQDIDAEFQPAPPLTAADVMARFEREVRAGVGAPDIEVACRVEDPPGTERFETSAASRGMVFPELSVDEELLLVEANEEASRRARAVYCGEAPRMTTAEFLATHVQLPQAELDARENATQGTPEWHAHRRFRVTASAVASLVGENPYETLEEGLRQKMWPHLFPLNTYVKWGSLCEEVAKQDVRPHLERVLEREYGVAPTFEERGLMVHASEPWIGVSPDWVARCGSKVVNVEFKCPGARGARRDDLVSGRAKRHPYARYPRGVPGYYITQVQTQMGVMRLFGWDVDFTLFVVWTPRRGWVTRVDFDPAHWARILGAARRVYFERLVPLFVAQLRGRLPFETVEAPADEPDEAEAKRRALADRELEGVDPEAFE